MQTQGTVRPYYAKVLSEVETMRLLVKLNGVFTPRSTQPGVKVYKIDGDGEAMVTAQADRTFKVELFKGKCPC